MSKLFFETTGTNPGRHGIHQISGEIVIDGKTVETFDFKVQPNPKAQIEDAALDIADELLIEAVERTNENANHR